MASTHSVVQNMKALKAICGILPVIFALAMAALPAQGQVPVADYLFNGHLFDRLGNAPALVELVPGDGSYAAATLDGMTTTGYRFSAGAGLQLATDGLLDNDEYTIAI